MLIFIMGLAVTLSNYCVYVDWLGLCSGKLNDSALKQVLTVTK